MAQAKTDPIRIDDLDDLVDYLTENLRCTKDVAVCVMNEAYLAGDLRLEKQDLICDGEPYGSWTLINAEFGHIELDPRGRVRVNARVRPWREAHYRVTEGCYARVIWPSHTSGDLRGMPADLSKLYPPVKELSDGWRAAAQPAPDQQQSRPTEAPKPAGGAKAGRKPSSTQAARDAAIQDLLDNDVHPVINVTWGSFCNDVRVRGDGFVGDPKDEKYKRGFTDDRITRVTRERMKRQA